MSSKLKLDWATHQAAKYACENWHYSRKIPKSKLVKIGVWENDAFIGVLIFSYGATPQIGKPYKLEQTEICELTRIALRKHIAPVSRILSVALRMLKKQSPGVRLVVSYADLDQEHHGGIYQATNWFYVGRTKPDFFIKVRGVIEHRKTVYDRYGCQSISWLQKNVDPKVQRIEDSGKHKYLMPLDDDMRRRLQPLKKPYPKRAASKENVAPVDQTGEGGENPTAALQSHISKSQILT